MGIIGIRLMDPVLVHVDLPDDRRLEIKIWTCLIIVAIMIWIMLPLVTMVLVKGALVAIAITTATIITALIETNNLAGSMLQFIRQEIALTVAVASSN